MWTHEKVTGGQFNPPAMDRVDIVIFVLFHEPLYLLTIPKDSFSMWKYNLDNSLANTKELYELYCLAIGSRSSDLDKYIGIDMLLNPKKWPTVKFLIHNS